MTAATPAGYPGAGAPQSTYAARRPSVETKRAFKTTELFVYVAAVIAVLIASMVVGSNGVGVDRFPAERAWLYITWLSIGYMISRGLAKCGSREPTDEKRTGQTS